MKKLILILAIVLMATSSFAGRIHRQKIHRPVVSQDQQIVRQQMDFHTMVRRNAISRQNQLNGFYTPREVFTDRPRYAPRPERYYNRGYRRW